MAQMTFEEVRSELSKSRRRFRELRKLAQKVNNKVGPRHNGHVPGINDALMELSEHVGNLIQQRPSDIAWMLLNGK